MAENFAEIPDLPSEQAIDRLVSLLEPYQRITQPKFYGMENLPEDGSLLVVNHTIYGFLDLPSMMVGVWKHRRILVRGLGEHAHYAIPVWRDVLGACGMVRGTRDNVRTLMHDRQTILVFPGGAREVNKRRGQQYQLLWGDRIGFARLAIEQGYPIVPCAAVGADDMFDVIVDQRTPLYGQLALAYEKVMGFPTPPVVRGVGLTGIPRPERLYFWFGEPIDTTGFAADDETGARAVRDEVKKSVMTGIQFLRDERDKDPHRDLTKRLLRSANLGTGSVGERVADEPATIPEPPSEQAIDRVMSLLEPFRRITQPKFYGIENLPDDGSLLVGNHTVYAFLDLPFMMAGVWKHRRLFIRTLGEDAHFKVPVWRDALGACGMVRGTRDNARALMRDRQTMLIFPGGSREVYKRRKQQYQLLWKERMGFARLAIEHGYPIVPCAAVGAEHMLDVIADVDTPIYGQLARLSKKVTGFPVPPLVRGIGLTSIPRPERLYFWFGEPIDTTGFAGHDVDAAAREVRDEVRQSVMAGIEFLHDERDKDPDRSLVKRLLRSPSLGTDIVGEEDA